MSFNSAQPNLISRNRYTRSALTDRIKKILSTTKLNIEEYLNNTENNKKNRNPNKYYFDYYQELDFSIDTKDPRNIESKIYLLLHYCVRADLKSITIKKQFFTF